MSDRKLASSAGGATIDYFTGNVVTANDYYPFGMPMPGRKYRADTSSYRYRYGFNGQ